MVYNISRQLLEITSTWINARMDMSDHELLTISKL